MHNYPRIFVILLLVLFFFSNETKAEEILTLLEKSSLTGLTWDDCVKETKQNHPDLISAHEKLNQAKANKTIAISDLLPQISGSLSEKTSGKKSALADFKSNRAASFLVINSCKKGLLSDKRSKSGFSRLGYLILKFPFTLTGLNCVRPNSLVSRLWAKSISRRP